MHILIIIIGLIVGCILNGVIERISYSLTRVKKKTVNAFTPIICGLSFEILFLRFGFTFILAKAIALTAILIIISIVDIKYRIIPDFMVVIALVVGIMFSFTTKATLLDAILGMICGGGILFIIAIIPNAMGGGDIKLMFALGAFLGLNGTLWALLIAFVLSSIVCIALILLGKKGTKDYIPFGPFLAAGSLISLLLFI